jgi:hypothetical protein
MFIYKGQDLDPDPVPDIWIRNTAIKSYNKIPCQVVTSIVEQPEEHCDLSPQKSCHHKTTLVPRLEPVPECTLVPREICNVKFVNTR